MMRLMQIPSKREFAVVLALFLPLSAPAILHAAQATPMILIPAGSFTMGRDDGPDDERPAHVVTLRAFHMDRLPVTNGDYALFLNAAGAMTPQHTRRYDFDDTDARIHRVDGRWVADKGYENHPAVEVSWAGARDYCAWRSARLPTEAEWEKAARGSDGRRYPWGNAPPDASRARYDAAFNATADVTAHPAGAGPYGVLDMAGNAWEWVSSAYRAYPWRADDGREDSLPGPVRGTRGGGHDSPAEEITSTQRGRALSRNPRAGHHNIAFRCAADKK